MFPFINPAPVLFAVTTLFGVVVHEMHIDRAATVAVALPAIMATVGVDKVISSNYHTQVERASIPRSTVSFRSALPNIQPPRDDDRKYIQNKKLIYSGGDQNHIWPSV